MLAFAPSMAADPRVQDWFGRLMRQGQSPGGVRALMDMYRAIDVRDVLASVHVPTLVLHRTDDLIVHVAQGRRIAEAIPDARFVELAGGDHVPWMEGADEIVGEVEEFLTGARGAHEPDRVLATVLFTDIVDSTQRASDMGDRRWRDLLDAHDGEVRRVVERQGGRVVKTTGDGALALFPGPAAAIRAASALRDAVVPLGLDVRVGLHTGECELRGSDVAGLAVHIGARVAASAEAGEIRVSRTVTDLVAGSGLAFEDRGEHELKGVPGTWQLFAVAA
jgi:class 3 adenylate cyclase